MCASNQNDELQNFCHQVGHYEAKGQFNEAEAVWFTTARGASRKDIPGSAWLLSAVVISPTLESSTKLRQNLIMTQRCLYSACSMES